MSAEHSHSRRGNDEKYGAHNAIDQDDATFSTSDAGGESSTWIKLNFDKVRT